MLFLDNSMTLLPYMGYLIITISIVLCYKVRKNEKLLFLFAILGFINISIAVSDTILLGIHVASWQMPLRETVYNLYAANSTLLFISVINLIMSTKWLDTQAKDITKDNFKRKDNIIIAYGGLAVMYIILLFGYDINSLNGEGYVSNNNPLIEYAIVIFAVVWLYSGDNRIVIILLKLFSFVYVILSMSFGDRSAAFLMILLYYLLFISEKRKLNLTLIKIITLAFIAILISNFAASYREAADFNFLSIIKDALERGIYSDTVSYSYYASITITAASHLDDTFGYFLEYLKTLVAGGGSSEFGNLARYVQENYLYNVGGGLYPSYFYFGLGYSGVFFSALILALIIRKIYSLNNLYALIYQILIPVLSIRWYLYGPTTFYRSILIITSILLLLCYIADLVLKKKVNKNLEVKNQIKFD